MDAPQSHGGHTYGATGSPSELEPAASLVVVTEQELPHARARLDGHAPAHFASVPGLKVVEFDEVLRSPIAPEPQGPLEGPDLFSERGYHVVEEVMSRLQPLAPPEIRAPELLEGAPIPGDVEPGETAIDEASQTVLLPRLDTSKLSEAERACTDALHMMRGGPAVSSQQPQN